MGQSDEIEQHRGSPVRYGYHTRSIGPLDASSVRLYSSSAASPARSGPKIGVSWLS